MMNFRLVTCIIVATWAVVAVNGAKHYPNSPSSQPPVLAPAPSAGCDTLIFEMVDCLSFLSNGGNETVPEASCCDGFKVVLDTDSECICEALKSSADLGVSVNMTKAAALPSDCGVSAPPLSSFSSAPGAAPGMSNPPTVNAPPPESPALPPTASAPPPKSTNPPVPSPTVNPSTPAPSILPRGGAAPAQSPANSGAYTTFASLAVLISVAFATCIFVLA
ncbi:unnamed protein product [Ilex paraguariensis]|uniref:Bifunctional inhibitor/plant lipid transfer protein/seed storage helical domain-containing protein n=1 Tax=Ilex paraguariensis TaxID=185542 RepID=A0ABC8TXR6_9AQUA